jgi:hypothetical protein
MSSGSFSLGDGPLLAARLDDAVKLLRQRVEQHAHQESRLHDYYCGLQQTWASHFDRMGRQMATLEGLLSAWTGPQLTVVTGLEGE